ncbi:hypothetical protein G7077_12405 [Sphingomonas piscis]|uniref:Alpha/beta hydrolase n=1 Tax=Sphingomonas piscis TaxID=2714943 RepID=A0A6G7YTN7_9SPHN|nr:hypothetical protein G7077_12405 [Sphingomonas piscis]
MLIALGASPLSAQAQPAPVSAAVEEGSGPYPAVYESDTSLPNHVVYRPRSLAALGATKLPVYVWGNGGCSADGTSSRNHLLEIASHGYLAIAAGTIPPAKDAAPAAAARPPQGPPPGQLKAATATSLLSDAIDWAVKENGRKGSPYYGRIATNRIAVSGWSCGGLQALNVAPDRRVNTAVIMNSGFFTGNSSPIIGIENSKDTLSRLHRPTLYVLGGKSDIAYENGMDDFRRINHVPAAVINIPVGHGGTYMQPHGGVGTEVVTRWLDWQLKGDRKAASSFTGADCGYCNDSRFTIERKKL